MAKQSELEKKVLGRSRNQRIRSAESVAYFRAVGANERKGHLRCPDYLAKHFIGNKFKFYLLMPVWYLKFWTEKILPGVYWYMIARTKHIDSILHDAIKNKCRQLVILGSGNDSRAYRFQDKLSKMNIFEVDFPGTLEEKKKRLKELFGSVPEHVTYVPIDFNHDSLKDVLLANGFDSTKRTLIIWEGVTYYLPESSVESVLNTIREIAPSGSRLVFDYARKSFIEGDYSTYGAKRLAWIWKKSGEPGLFGIEDGAIDAFLEEKQFKMIDNLGPEDLERCYINGPEGKPKRRVFGFMEIVYTKSI